MIFKTNFLLCVIIIKIYSSPLFESRGKTSNPLALINNPSYISLQEGVPLGVELSYNPDSKSESVSSGIIKKYKKTALSFYFSRDFDDNLNNFFIGASTFSDKASGGFGFHFLSRNDEIEFTFDIGTTFFINDIINVSASLKNVFFYDKEDADYSPNLRLSSGGYIKNNDNIYYNVFVFNRFIDTKKRKFSFGGGGSSQIYFFNNPSLRLYISSFVERDEKKNIFPFIKFSAGTYLSIKTSKIGFSAGMQSNIVKKSNNILISFFFNPLSVKKSDLKNINISTDKLEFSPNGDGINDKLYIKIDCNQKRNISTEKWVLTILKTDERVNKIVKTFTGGGTPPGTIFWNGRDDNDNIADENFYMIKAVVVDNYGNKHISSLKKIKLIKE